MLICRELKYESKYIWHEINALLFKKKKKKKKDFQVQNFHLSPIPEEIAVPQTSFLIF